MTRLSRGLFGVALAFVIAFGGSPALAAPTPTQPTAEESLTVQANGIFDISTTTVKVDSQTCTGSKLEPVPTVTFNKTELKPDVDFTCTYGHARRSYADGGYGLHALVQEQRQRRCGDRDH